MLPFRISGQHRPRGYVAASVVIVLASCLAIIGGSVSAQPTGPQQEIESILNGLICPQGESPEPARFSTDEDGYLRSLGAPPGCYFPLAPDTPSDSAGAARRWVLFHSAAFYSPSPNVGFHAARVRTSNNRSYVRLQQTYKGIPVFGGEATVQLNFIGQVIPAQEPDPRGVESVNANLLRNPGVLDAGNPSTDPTLSAEQAQAKAREILEEEKGAGRYLTTPPVLKLFVPGIVGAPEDDIIITGDGSVRLVWETIGSSATDATVRRLMLIDAHSGEVAFQYSMIHSALDREVYDANNQKGVDPGTLERDEGDPPSGIADVDQVYDQFADTYNFYLNNHGRDSIDDGGMTLIGITRYCPPDPPAPDPPAACPMTNAFWNGSNMHFGDGYAIDDVVGHELTHGVTGAESGLIYANQSGAINESFSDIWGEFIDLTNSSGTDTAAVRWLMGEDLPGGAIRDMQDPPNANDPDRMGSPLFRPWTATPNDDNDQGGVHTNSGVGNKLAYLLTDGDTFNGHTVTGMGIPRIADLFYEAQVNLLNSSSDYADLGVQLMQAAVNLGWNDSERGNLRQALCAVEIIPDSCTNTVTACIFDDHNANGIKDPGEDNVDFVGWGFGWTGLCAGSTSITEGNCVRLFSNFAAGAYQVWLDVNSVDCKFDDPTGADRRWMYTTPAQVVVNVQCDQTYTVEFGVVELGTITVRKWDDRDMDAVKDLAESYMDGWPIRLTAPTPTLVCPLVSPLNGVTEVVFEDLIPGTYTAREDLPWETAQPCPDDPYTVNRVTFQGKRWQATTDIEYTFSLPEGADVVREFGNVCLGELTACKFYDRNMSGDRQPVAETYNDANGNGEWDPAELYADINTNGIWDPAEPYNDANGNGQYDFGESFSDLNGNGCWDQGEPLRDENANGVWDPAEPWDDTFANGVWDDAEETLPDWPMALCGSAADGRCIGITASTDANGCAVLSDVPPGLYYVSEDVEWCGSKIDYCKGGVAPPIDQRKTTYNGRRWLATTDIVHQIDYSECATVEPFVFGNVALGSISGILSQQDCIGDPLTPLAGWDVCLKIAYVEPTVTFTPLPLLATDPDCNNLADNCTTTGGNGFYRFGELVPGVYLARVVTPQGYAPVGSAVDTCVPYRVVAEDVTRDLLVRDINVTCPVYQAYAGFSEGQSACAGYRTNGAFPVLNATPDLPWDPITAVPGILSIGPGSKWENFVRAYRACEPYCVKDVQLHKQHAELRQCSDVFPPSRIVQHGTSNIRTWWPLMYEPAGTEWTLHILYTTYNPVQLDGESFSSVVHTDRWSWRVEVTLDSLDLLIDLFHQVPFGKDEVPLISDEVGYRQLKLAVAEAKLAGSGSALAQALSEMELLISDMCIYTSPTLPYPTGDGRGLGVANTVENPACCKILTDLDFLLRENGAP